jgi:hypothetical protein
VGSERLDAQLNQTQWFTTQIPTLLRASDPACRRGPPNGGYLTSTVQDYFIFRYVLHH